MILRVIVFMEWFWGIFMERSGKFKDLRFRYGKKQPDGGFMEWVD